MLQVNLEVLDILGWWTYPRNETLVHQQLSLHQLYTPPSPHSTSSYVTSRVQERILVARSYALLTKIIATCIERTTADNTRVKREYKSVSCYSQLSGSSLEGVCKKP